MENGDEVSPFLKKIEEVLKKFAGEAYPFRYYLEEPSNMAQPKTEKNGSKNHNGSGFRKKKGLRAGFCTNADAHRGQPPNYPSVRG